MVDISGDLSVGEDGVSGSLSIDFGGDAEAAAGAAAGAAASASSSIGGAIGGAFGDAMDAVSSFAQNFYADGVATVRANIQTGHPIPAGLSPLVENKVSRVVVDAHLHQPSMFEVWFIDEEGYNLDIGGLDIGTAVHIYGGSAKSNEAPLLISGEVTSVEAVCTDLHIYSIIRGYDKTHRLQRARRTRTYLNMTYADIANQIAGEAELEIGTVDSTAVTHDHVSQVAQTDWEFLRQLAREIGYEVGIEQTEFYFRKASGNTQMGGGGGMPGGDAGGGGMGDIGGAVGGAIGGDAGAAVGGAVNAAADFLGLGGGGGGGGGEGGAVTLTYKDNLLQFMPRVTAANITPEVEVRVWDAQKAEAVASNTGAYTGSTATEDDPAELTESFGGFQLPFLPKLPKLPPPFPQFGDEPSDKAFVMTNVPLANGNNASIAADEAAKALTEHYTSAFVEAEGVAAGDSLIQPGTSVMVKGVPKRFETSWFVTNARHVFDDEEGGYSTRFIVSGRHDRSLLGLVSAGSSGGGAGTAGQPAIAGLVCGVVTNISDPDDKCRVKVTLPWLSPSFESDWARVVQFCAGPKSGSIFLPDVGDEVLVGFEMNDSRRPYVIGGLLNDNTEFDLGDNPVKVMGMSGQVVKRGFVSASGNQLLFDDEVIPPPGAGPALGSAVTLGNQDEKFMFKYDRTAGTLDIICDPVPPDSRAVGGTVTIKSGGTAGAKITIEAGPTGTIDIKTGTGGQLNIDGGATLNIKAQATVKIESTGMVEVSGNPIKLN